MKPYFILRVGRGNPELARDVRDLVRGTDSVIFGCLLKSEYKKLEKGISFSGSTGTYSKKGYGRFFPYIASFGSEVEKAIILLGWKKLRITKAGEQWQIVRDKV